MQSLWCQVDLGTKFWHLLAMWSELCFCFLICQVFSWHLLKVVRLELNEHTIDPLRVPGIWELFCRCPCRPGSQLCCYLGAEQQERLAGGGTPEPIKPGPLRYAQLVLLEITLTRLLLHPSSSLPCWFLSLTGPSRLSIPQGLPWDSWLWTWPHIFIQILLWALSTLLQAPDSRRGFVLSRWSS